MRLGSTASISPNEPRSSAQRFRKKKPPRLSPKPNRMVELIANDNRTLEIWSALNTVTDPELDESVTSLKFITSVRIEPGDEARIEFRLPTYWCAPNFAFLMASDMRDAVTEIAWVQKVNVELLDHFSAELINRGVALRQDFRDAFPGETDDDLTSVRQKFLGKAYQRRQEMLMRHLLGNGGDPVWFARVTLRELLCLPLEAEGVALRNLYVFSWRRIHA